MIVRRLTLVLSIVVCGSLALAAAALAAGGFLPPGQYSSNDTSANAYFGGKGGPPQGFSVFVHKGFNSFHPENSNGSGTVTMSTMVQISWFSPTGGGYACYVIPDSDFVVSDNLQSASLHTTLDANSLCPGFGAPAFGSAAVPPLAAHANQVAAINAGGPPPPPPTMTVDVTWTGLGVISTGRGTKQYECLDFSTDGSFTSRASSANATGTLSVLTGSFTKSGAVVGSSNSQINVNGYLSPACA